MTALVDLTEEERYLVALLTDPTGIDQAEFLWVDQEQGDNCFRLYDFQWYWFACDDKFQADQCGRDLGKTTGIIMRGFSFPFVFPGSEMCITAPELNHLRPLTDLLEWRITSCKLTSEMLPKNRGRGMARQPHWQVRFANGTRIISRLPNRDGKGIKGVHSAVLELDEAQDYPREGWVEIIETFKERVEGSTWRCHGVPRGVRDKFYEITQDDSEFTVHRKMGMHRPSWSAQERQAKIKLYGGSRQNTDYRRNVYGDHGDATNPVFVLSRLTARVDLDEGSEYNSEIYRIIRINHELLSPTTPIEALLDQERPTHHLSPNVIAKDGYAAYWGGMDVGLTDHPSEVLIFGQRAGTKEERLDLLLRINLQRIESADQLAVVDWVFALYGTKLKGFGIDRTGLGFPIFQDLRRRPYGKRVHGWNFSEEVVVGFEDREPAHDETMEDLAIMRNFLEASTDHLRNEWVDGRRVQLPFDRELLTEWQGQNYVTVKASGSPYGKRQYSQGKFHTLDAARCAAGAKFIPPLQEIMANTVRASVLEQFPDVGELEPALAAASSANPNIPATSGFDGYGVL